jgi:hypothetical protein
VDLFADGRRLLTLLHRDDMDKGFDAFDDEE